MNASIYHNRITIEMFIVPNYLLYEEFHVIARITLRGPYPSHWPLVANLGLGDVVTIVSCRHSC